MLPFDIILSKVQLRPLILLSESRDKVSSHVSGRRIRIITNGISIEKCGYNTCCVILLTKLPGIIPYVKPALEHSARPDSDSDYPEGS